MIDIDIPPTSREYPAYKYEPYPYPKQNNPSYIQNQKDKELEESFKSYLFYFWYYVMCCGACEETVSDEESHTLSKTKHNKNGLLAPPRQQTYDMESSEIVPYMNEPSEGSMKSISGSDKTTHSAITTKASNVSTISKKEQNYPNADTKNLKTQKYLKNNHPQIHTNYDSHVILENNHPKTDRKSKTQNTPKNNPKTQYPTNNTSILGMTRKNLHSSRKIPIPKQLTPMNLKLLCFTTYRNGIRNTNLLPASCNNYSKKKKTFGLSSQKHPPIRKQNKVVPSRQEI